MQPEARFKKHLRESFETVMASAPYYWLPLVASMMQKAGIPDLWVADGKIGAWIETKVNGNGLSAIQALEQRKMAMAGATVIVLHTHLGEPEETRRIDWSRFRRDGLGFDKSSHLYWQQATTPQFWSFVIHGP